MRKLFDNIKVLTSLDAEVYTAVTEGGHVIDSQGYGDGMLVAVVGDITDTDADSYTIRLMECDTSTGTFTTTGIELVFAGEDANDNTNKVARIAELNVTRKRFLRADLAFTAATSSFEGAALILLGEGVDGPVNED